jgi:hypothetical protein
MMEFDLFNYAHLLMFMIHTLDALTLHFNILERLVDADTSQISQSGIYQKPLPDLSSSRD